MEELDRLVEWAEKSNVLPPTHGVVFKEDIQELLDDVLRVEELLCKVGVRLGIIKNSLAWYHQHRTPQHRPEPSIAPENLIEQ
jgi:hypothetical protein